jgi:hypothetical protein
VVSAGEAIVTVGELDCGWGTPRLRAIRWDYRDRVCQRRGGARIRILIVLALFHGIVPPLTTGTE